MGQITIEIPQSVNRNYRIISTDSAKTILSKIEILVKEENNIQDDEVLGMWSDRKQSVQEISNELRNCWDRNDKVENND